MNLVFDLIGALFLSNVSYYLIFSFLNIKFKYNKRLLLMVLLYAFMLVFLYSIINNYVRIIIIYLILIVSNYWLLKQEIIKISISSFLTYIIMFLSEMLYFLFLVLIFNGNVDYIKDNFFVKVTSNIIISFIMLSTTKISFIKKKLVSIVNNTKLKDDLKFIAILFGSLTIIAMIIYYIYFEVNPIYAVVLNIILICMYTFLTLCLFKENSDKYKIQVKYDNMISNIDNYEDMINQLRIKNHENRNNLIVIRSMMNNKEKDIIEYIDTTLNDLLDSDDSLINMVQYIPLGGLQGLIYQKLKVIKQNNIVFQVEASKSLQKINLKKMSSVDKKNICTIVGIFLDNAIQAVEKLRKKYIGIYLYKEEKYLVIKLTNNYEGVLEIDKMDEPGYSTKNGEHGYGLYIVKDIINKNHNLHHVQWIDGNLFSQIIKIEIKKI